ncbi:hypothetical protein JCM5296_002858 [Sporobolomyces johnsonii]
MLHRLRHASAPIAQLAKPPTPPTPARAVCSFCGAVTASPGGRRRVKGKQPSTSAVSYCPSPTSFTAPPSSRSYSTSAPYKRSSRPSLATTSPPPSLAELLALPADTVTYSVLLSSFSHLDTSSKRDPSLLTSLDRATFDALYSRFSRHANDALKLLRQLRRFAKERMGWELSEGQMRVLLHKAVLSESAPWKSNGAKTKGKGKERMDVQEENGASAGPSREELARRAQDRRERITDTVADDYLSLLDHLYPCSSSVPPPPNPDVADTLQRYALALSSRAVTPETDERSTDERSSLVLQRAMAFAEPLAVPAPSHEASVILSRLFRNPEKQDLAMAHLRSMLGKGRLPTFRAVKEIIEQHYAARLALAEREPRSSQDFDPALLARFDETAPAPPLPPPPAADDSASYQHARTVLAEICSSTGSSSPSASREKLDLLLRERLERVDRLEEVEADPTGAFVKWLGVGLAQEGERRSAGLEMALRMWEVAFTLGKEEGARLSRRRVKLLELLVLEACKGEALPSSSELKESRPSGSSPLVDLAVSLAMKHLPHQVLVHNSPPLLLAVTSTTHSPTLALQLFDTLLSPPPSTAFAPFRWTTSLIPALKALLFSSAAANNPALALRLYLSWTSSGLTFPVGLWMPLWRALGRRGSVEELARVVEDWEETGRGQVSARIIDNVLRASLAHADGRSILPSLRLFDYFRGRYASSPLSPPSDLVLTSQRHILVPLSSYNALLHAVARTSQDRRSTLTSLFRQLKLDGYVPTTESYNALIAAQVFRPIFRIRDIDLAGVAYNQLVAAGCRPDRATFSLLLHGFNRLAARESDAVTLKRQRLGIEAALRTFDSSLSPALGREGDGVGPSVRGHQASRLVRLLARHGRFDEAKVVAERWWRALVKREEREGGEMWDRREVIEECEEMRKAGRDVQLLEARWAKGEKEAEGESAEEPKIEERKAQTEQEDEVAVSPEAFPASSSPEEAA